MGKLIMVRHGESEGNRDRRFTSSPEVPITELGRQQALDAAHRIAIKFKPRLVISSPYRRARQTSEIIAGELGLPIEVVHDLHERDLGVLKGQSYDLLRDLAGQDSGYDPKRGWLWRPEGGESYEDVRKRVIVAIEDIRRRYPGGRTRRGLARRRNALDVGSSDRTMGTGAFAAKLRHRADRTRSRSITSAAKVGGGVTAVQFGDPRLRGISPTLRSRS